MTLSIKLRNNFRKYRNQYVNYYRNSYRQPTAGEKFSSPEVIWQGRAAASAAKSSAIPCREPADADNHSQTGLFAYFEPVA